MRLISTVDLVADGTGTSITESIELHSPWFLRRFALGQAKKVQRARVAELDPPDGDHAGKIKRMSMQPGVMPVRRCPLRTKKQGIMPPVDTNEPPRLSPWRFGWVMRIRRAAGPRPAG